MFPSESAKKQTRTEFEFWADAKALAKNKNFIIMVISYMNMYSVYSCLAGTINNIVEPYEYTTKDASLFGVLFIIFGLIGSFTVAKIIDKTSKFLFSFQACCILTLFSIAIMAATLPSKKVPLFAPNVSAMGLFLLPIIPLGYTFSIELTFPVSEAMSNGIMALAANSLGFGITYLVTYFASKKNGVYYVGGFFAI